MPFILRQHAVAARIHLVHQFIATDTTGVTSGGERHHIVRERNARVSRTFQSLQSAHKSYEVLLLLPGKLVGQD
jgi:hypothetical protein